MDPAGLLRRPAQRLTDGIEDRGPRTPPKKTQNTLLNQENPTIGGKQGPRSLCETAYTDGGFA